MTKEIADAGTLSTKAGKALDTMRARAVKADEARTEAAHRARAAQVVPPRPRPRREPRRGRGMGRPGDRGRRPGRPVPPRGRAGRPHPAPVGALGRRGGWRTRGGLSRRTAGCAGDVRGRRVRRGPSGRVGRGGPHGGGGRASESPGTGRIRIWRRRWRVTRRETTANAGGCVRRRCGQARWGRWRSGAE